jgi:hypothetical protein
MMWSVHEVSPLTLGDLTRRNRGGSRRTALQPISSGSGASSSFSIFSRVPVPGAGT